MLTIRRSGPDLHTIARQIGSVPKSMIPYAASTALTRVAQHAARTELPAEMRKVFDGPTAWTLGSLRTVPATRTSLVARVAVKDAANGRAIPQEKFLLPEVEGGPRRQKRMEVALRYAGVLRAGQFAVPGEGATLDANGNVKGADVRSILAALKKIRAVSTARDRRTGKTLRKGRALANDLFAGVPNGGSRPDGIWRREGHRLRALFVFTSQPPQYGKRLDFDGTVARVAQERFRPEFERAVADLKARGGAWA